MGGYNTKWYRLYSDGWVEQGEYLDVNVSAGAERGLSYPMADTNYIAVASTNTYTSGTGTHPLNISKTTDKVLIKSPGAYGTFGSSYYVCGMSALGPSQQTRYIIKF